MKDHQKTKNCQKMLKTPRPSMGRAPTTATTTTPLHSTTLHFTTLHYNYNYNYNSNNYYSYNYDISTTTTLTTTTLQYNYNCIYNYNYIALHYTTLHPAVVLEVTSATTPKSTTPSTFRSISGFALPSMIHNNQPLLGFLSKLPPPPCAILLGYLSCLQMDYDTN